MPDASQTFPIPDEPDEKPAEELGLVPPPTKHFYMPPDQQLGDSEVRSGTKELSPEAAACFEARVSELYGLIPHKPGGISWVPPDESEMDRRDRVGIETHGLNPVPWPDDPKPEPEAPIVTETAQANIAKAFREGR